MARRTWKWGDYVTYGQTDMYRGEEFQFYVKTGFLSLERGWRKGEGRSEGAYIWEHQHVAGI